MKLIHLSDLHLGKRVNEFSMIEDQKYILNEILRIIDEEAPDGILLAGDLYDRPVPSAEAVQLFDRFLTQLAERKIPVYAISGNHDSAERIAFGSQIMSSSGICMSPVYDGKTEKYCLTDSYGEVWIHLLPFVRPATVRHGLEGEEEVDEIRTYQEAVQGAVAHMEIDKRYRNVLIAHQFVVGAMRCDSEEISVGVSIRWRQIEYLRILTMWHLAISQSSECGKRAHPLLRNSFEIFFFRGRTAEIRDSCGASGKRKSQDHGDSAEASSGYAKTERHIHGGHITVQLSGHKHRGLCADHADR